MKLAVLLFLAFMTTLPAQDQPTKTETATLGSGCFWCLEAIFESQPGVLSVTSGYAGGTSENPTYEAVCTGRTGHAEVVRIAFDPAQTSYEKILELFWKVHDPTTPGRQGADVGTQYRSIILTENDEQAHLANASKHHAQSQWKTPIITEIAPLKKFYPAEEGHQDFSRRNPSHPYNTAVIQPKLQNLQNKK